jgi:hypothetical protein
LTRDPNYSGTGVALAERFFALALGLLCAIAIDPMVRNALIQKLAANFR